MYDMIIIGSGVAGLGAAIYAKRFGMNILVVGDLTGGTITLTHLVENYPGFTSLSGLELANNLIKHAEANQVIIKQKKITKIEKTEDCFQVKAGNENFHTKTVLIATGTEHRELGVPGEKELKNKGVSYCATCDGPFFKGRVVAIVGGGDSAAKESLILSEYASKVYLIVRGYDTKAEPINKKRVKDNPKIEMMAKTEIAEIIGRDKIEKIKFKDGRELELGGLFIEVGRLPRSKIVEDLGVELNEKKEIIIGKHSETNIEGLFAAGDVTDTEWKQAVTGVAEGALAAYYGYTYLGNKEIICR